MSNLNLRAFLDDDMDLLKKWLYKPHVVKWFEHPEHWIDEVSKRNDEFRWIHHYIVEVGGNAIGFCQYYNYLLGGEDWHGNMDIKGAYSIDYLIGEEDYLGNRLGQDIIIRLKQKIQAEADATKIIVQPEPDNAASRKTLLNAGCSYDKVNDVFYIILLK